MLHQSQRRKVINVFYQQSNKKSHSDHQEDAEYYIIYEY